MDSSLEHAASYTKAGHPFFFLGARGEAGTRNLALKVEGNGEVLRVGPSEWMSVVAITASPGRVRCALFAMASYLAPPIGQSWALSVPLGITKPWRRTIALFAHQAITS